MRGLWLENQKLTWRDNLPQPTPAPGEVLVEVVRAGICNTDLELLRGYYPYCGVPGHEFVGIVRSPDHPWAGKRVVGDINAACGQCDFCRQGVPSHCRDRTVLGIVQRSGAFAEYLTLPSVNLHRLPPDLDTDAATFIEPLAAALEILAQVHISPRHRVLVVGDGKLGQLVAQVLALTGCDLQVVGRHSTKLGHLERLGLKVAVVQPSEPEPYESRSFDVAVDCTGHPSGFAQGLGALRPRGTLVLKSTYAGRLALDASAVVVDEITLVGSRCGPFAPAIALLSQGKIQVSHLIQHRYPLSQGLAAFAQAQQRGSLKVLLTPDIP